MKILDQYIYAIGTKLPYNARKEIKQELNSLLLDEIENRYGDNATEENVRQVIADYGSPREVAGRYKQNNLVIGAGYSDLYFFITKIILLAMTIGFTTIFLIGLFTKDMTGNALVVELAKVLGRVFQGTLSGIGWLTVIFIIMTRVNNDRFIDLEESWTPDALKDIQIGPEGESRIESAFSIFATLIWIVVINTFPGLTGVAERSFSQSGLLGHTLALDVFKTFLLPLSVLWFGSIIYHILNLFYGSKTRNIALFSMVLEYASTIILFLMVTSTTLYVGYTSIVGFKLVFLIIAIISLIESLNKTVKFLRYFVIRG